MTVVAAFDFDETLTQRDTVVPFLRRFTTPAGFATSLLPQTRRFLPMAIRRDRDRLRELATRIVFAGRPFTEIEAEARSFGAMVAAGWLRHDTTARLRWHLEQGHRVAIVSASYEPYVRVVAAQLGDVDVVATRFDVTDGHCTGNLDGANCRGAEKLRRLDAWLGACGLERSAVTLFAYGDSAGDRELLGAADHPHWVNEPLASVAPTV